ncbi:hypothetical protein [Terricaulis sp.]|uniref:hypothetical protein n=1 Tax=Terricaulis sp. TaxID=2768686 RepID=UPI003784B739
MPQYERIIIAGQSHADTLFNDQHRASDAPTLVRLDADAEVYGLVSAMPRGPDYWDALREHAAGSIVVLVWGGNDHNAWFLFQTTPHFDFVRADLPNVDPKAKLIPASLVHQLFYANPEAEQCKALVRELSERGDCRVLMMETPPPKGEEAELKKLLASEYAHVAQQRGMAIENIPLTDRMIRLKLWRAFRDASVRIARENGAEFLSLPAWAFDGEGFFRRAYWQNDATHGSSAYGTQVRRELINGLLSA